MKYVITTLSTNCIFLFQHTFVILVQSCPIISWPTVLAPSAACCPGPRSGGGSRRWAWRPCACGVRIGLAKNESVDSDFMSWLSSQSTRINNFTIELSDFDSYFMIRLSSQVNLSWVDWLSRHPYLRISVRASTADMSRRSMRYARTHVDDRDTPITQLTSTFPEVVAIIDIYCGRPYDDNDNNRIVCHVSLQGCKSSF